MSGIREQINAKPQAVRTLLMAFMVKRGIEDDSRASESDAAFESLGGEALAWWADIARHATEIGMSEADASAYLVARLRNRPVWKQILRGDA